MFPPVMSDMVERSFHLEFFPQHSFADCSGAHLNPAVIWGLRLSGRKLLRSGNEVAAASSLSWLEVFALFQIFISFLFYECGDFCFDTHEVTVSKRVP